MSDSNKIKEELSDVLHFVEDAERKEKEIEKLKKSLDKAHKELKIYKTKYESILNLFRAELEATVDTDHYHCVICGNKEIKEPDFYIELGNFNDVICDDCKDTPEGKETIEDYL